ncbi:MAG TPA: hypothetical protein VD905_14435 [Flavobacteriales bacterium]|nr:hypothetical protein [Flavobacteriales bacterium]
MKKLFFISLSVLVLASCGGGSKKGAWSEADKKKADEEIKKADADLAAFGDKKDAFVKCYLDKIEDNFDNFDQANKDLEGCKKYATECAQEVMK